MNDGQDIKLAESANEAETAKTNGSEKQDRVTVPSPEYGFDETGQYFVVRVHINHGYIFILGFLEKAKDFLKMHVAKQMAEMQKHSLIRPNQKGFGRFNPFKR